jgi:putative transcription factor
LALTCEVCGVPIKGPPTTIEIDGAFLKVCPSCAKRGTPIAPRAVRKTSAPYASEEERLDEEIEIDPEYHNIIRHGREKMGLTQEQLGRAINVKPSVISHLETAKMKPDMLLARKLMHQLKVNLLVPSGELDSDGRP